jgi:hypothetical protein
LLQEFHRILCPGGVAGFAEVGPEHSQSDGSQLEMRTFRVLENDLDMESIWEMARDIGFSEIYFKPFSHPDFSMDYRDYIRVSRGKKIPRSLYRHLCQSTRQYPVFFLIKGDFIPDSRNPDGLGHRIFLASGSLKVPVNQTLVLKLGIENSGDSLWLDRSLKDMGTVFIGAHLHDSRGKVLDFDYDRWRIDRAYHPGQKGEQELRLKFKKRGHFRLVIDLVSEQVCWFESRGSQPVSIKVTVT